MFIDRIEPGRDGHDHPVLEGYGENGIWIRGQRDYAEPRVAGAIGTGRFPMVCPICCSGVRNRIAFRTRWQ